MRIAGSRAFLTLKNEGSGITRNEYDYEIPFEDAVEIMKQLFDYLQVPDFDLKEMLEQRFNVAPPKQMPDGIREELQTFFAPFNQQLNDFLGRQFY